MKELLDQFTAWQADEVEVGRAVVLRTYGSAPRREGSVLLYSADGRIAGSVSGGCVESAVAQEIDASRAAGTPRTVSYGISDEDAWSIGLACGGTIDVLIEPEVAAEIVAAARSEDGAAVITRLPAQDTAELRLAYDATAGLRGSTGDADTDQTLVAASDEALLRGTSRVVEVGSDRYFVEAFPVRPRIVIVGAVEIARPLTKLAHDLGFETVVVDGRPTFATRERFPMADRIELGWLDEMTERIALSASDCVVVLTHDPKFDEPAITAALRKGCRYVGAIGSKKTQADRRARLHELGLDAAQVQRLHGPIGLDLGGREPAETALAILAEIVAQRYSASGQPLRDRALVQAAG